MRILVTGGAGRLGSELIKLITSEGDSAVAFDLPQASWEAIQGISGVEVFHGDVTNSSHISEACADVDAVFHLAAILPPNSEANRDLTMKVNVEGTRKIVETLGLHQNTPMVFASSISTYGITAEEEPPIREDHPLMPHNNYSESKIEAERLIRYSGVPHTILRIAPISVADIVELPETIPYRGDQRVEFVNVTDAARALLSAFENQGALGEVYNIAGGASWRMRGREYITRFYGALGVEIEPRFSGEFTALDWYDTSRSRFLGYQKITFNEFLTMLRSVGEQLGLR